MERDLNYEQDNYAISLEKNQMKAFSTGRLPFEPKGWQKYFRGELRENIGKLHIGENEMLLAKYGSTMISRGVDTENILFYNVGASAFRRVANHAIGFESLSLACSSFVLTDAKPFSHYYSYEIIKLMPEEKLWWQENILAEWRDIQIGNLCGAHKPLKYWKALKESPNAIRSGIYNSVTSDFGLSIQILAPQNEKVNLTAIMKPLLDGVICAFHSYKDPQTDNFNDIANLLGCEVELLINTDFDIFGAEKYVCKYREKVKWNPQDDRCKMVQITIAYETNNVWSFSGQIYPISFDQ